MVERVVFPFRGAEIGGSHVAAFTLATALQEKFRIDCAVICPPDTLIMAEARRLGLRTLSSGEKPTGRNSVIADYSGITRRRNILRQEQAGGGCVLHCSDINTLRAWGPAARLSGMAVIYHHHALNRMWWPPHLAGLVSANAVICVSDITAAGMRLVRPDAIKEFNPFDVDPATAHGPARRAFLDEFGWPENARIVGWVGNFWARKRPLFFLDVAAELVRSDPSCRFVLFGRDGDHTIDELRLEAADRGLSAVTAFPGFRLPVTANVASLDVLLAPALREPFGRTLVEAIILGTPLVATTGAGHSEIIDAWGGGVLACQEASPAEVAIFVLDALKGHYRLSLARRREIAAELAPAAHAERVLAIYERALRGRMRRADGAGVVTS